MTENAVLRLRSARLARATRPFLARGSRVHRCERCLLPLKNCLCDTITPQVARSQFCLLMYDTEPLKPSNTGRLIADILPATTAFSWSRTEPPAKLLTQVQNPNVQPLVVFPASFVSPTRKIVTQLPCSGVAPLFIMLDGTWSEARKMFRKSPWLDSFPVISVGLARTSIYSLREPHGDGQYCTAEVACALLEIAGDTAAAHALNDHFLSFRARYLAGKSHHRKTVTPYHKKSQ